MSQRELQKDRTVIFTLQFYKHPSNIDLSVLDIYHKFTLGPDPKVEKLWAKTPQMAAL